MYDNIPATKLTMISFEELGIGSGEMGGFTGIQRYSKSRTSELMDRKAINGLVGLAKTSKMVKISPSTIVEKYFQMDNLIEVV